MSHDSRESILHHLKRNEGATVLELSHALGRTPVTVRHHLAWLLQAGLVETPSPRHKAGPGRPEKVYHLSPLADQHLPDNSGELVSVVLAPLVQALGDPDAIHILEGCGRRFGEDLCTGWSGDPEQRWPQALSVLEERGYFPTLQPPGLAREVHFSHCPYASAVRQVPLLCRFDAALLGGLLAAEVVPVGSIARGDASCVFQLPVDRSPTSWIK